MLHIREVGHLTKSVCHTQSIDHLKSVLLKDLAKIRNKQFNFDPAVVIVSKLLFNHACNKILETEIKDSSQLGSEIGYFQFLSQVSLDFLKNKTGLGYVD